MSKIAVDKEAFNTRALNEEQISALVSESFTVPSEEFTKFKRSASIKPKIIKDGVWYNDRHIDVLLKRANLKDTYIAPTAYLTLPLPDLWHDIFAGIKDQFETKNFNKAIIPVNTEGRHWVGIVIKKNGDSDNYQVIYTDSGGKALSSYKGGIDVINLIQEIYFPSESGHGVIDVSCKQNSKGTCGGFTIASVIAIAKAETNSNQQVLKDLLVSGRVAAKNLRAIHNEVLSYYQAQEATQIKGNGVQGGKTLIYAVSLKNKGQMAFVLEETERPKDIESIRELSVIKRSYELALGKGPSFTKAFLRAMERFNFDSPEIAQGFIELKAIVEKYKTAAEVLESVEWKSIGAKPGAAGIEFLESVVSKGKAEMLTELTSNSHLKVVEELSSISPFKKACERSLEKGLVYTKKFIGALQKNYSFDPKVAQDLNELSKIVVSHNTFSEIVESEDWIKIGGDTGSSNDYDF